jgi:hypothetical protein
MTAFDPKRLLARIAVGPIRALKSAFSRTILAVDEYWKPFRFLIPAQPQIIAVLARPAAPGSVLTKWHSKNGFNPTHALALSKRLTSAEPKPVTHPAVASHLGQWRQTYERYKGLAESACNADAVTREGYWQHAEHFLRLINEAEAAHQPG